MINELFAYCVNLVRDVYWIEGVAYRIIAAIITLTLFVMWRRRGSLLMYQAWALFGFFLNLTLLYHDIFNVISKNGRLLISIAFFINNLVVIYRSWQYSEKYIPKKKIRELSKEATAPKVFSKTVLTRAIALWVTIKDGGNNHQNIPIVKKRLSTHLN